MAIDVGEHDFQQRVVEASSDRPVVVDFWAGWCRPCLVLGPVLERLVEEHGDDVVLAKVDVDANPGLAARFGIQGIPAVKAFRDGRVVSEFVGAQPEDVVRRFLQEVAPSDADRLAVAGRSHEDAGSLGDAEEVYREALEHAPGHPAATVGLARVLVAAGRPDEAAPLLATMPPTDEVRSLQARLSLSRAPEGDSPMAQAAAAAAAGDHRRALELALGLVSDGEGDEARDLMVRVFQALGDDHPLTREFRPRLARALF